MENEEILKRLAKMVGIEKGHSNYPALRNHYVVTVNEGEWLEGERTWNPLESWSDCGPLVEKYSVCCYTDPEGWWALVWPDLQQDSRVQDHDLKRAICLAIIESRADEKAA